MVLDGKLCVRGGVRCAERDQSGGAKGAQMNLRCYGFVSLNGLQLCRPLVGLCLAL